MVEFNVASFKFCSFQNNKYLDPEEKKIIAKLPKSHTTLAKRIKVVILQCDKYFYCSCGLIGPIKPADFNSTKEFFCKSKCRSIVPKVVNDDNYFCYSSIRIQLEAMLPVIYSKLRFDPPISSNGSLRDIVNGEAYQKLAGPGRIVLTIGWDGVETKTNKSVWPLFAFICELPLNMREKVSRKQQQSFI